LGKCIPIKTTPIITHLLPKIGWDSRSTPNLGITSKAMVKMGEATARYKRTMLAMSPTILIKTGPIFKTT
jgi:hypothetical protein